jgi:hypothetical protein
MVAVDPFAFNDRPVGKLPLPELIDQVYGANPPDAVHVAV